MQCAAGRPCKLWRGKVQMQQRLPVVGEQMPPRTTWQTLLMTLPTIQATGVCLFHQMSRVIIPCLALLGICLHAWNGTLHSPMVMHVESTARQILQHCVLFAAQCNTGKAWH